MCKLTRAANQTHLTTTLSDVGSRMQDAGCRNSKDTGVPTHFHFPYPILMGLHRVRGGGQLFVILAPGPPQHLARLLNEHRSCVIMH